MPKKPTQGFLEDEESYRRFGFRVGDIVLTPLGVEVTILGVRSGKIWALFPSEYEFPLEPESSSDQFEERGYSKVHESRHILRDKEISERKKAENLSQINWDSVMPWLNPANTHAANATQLPSTKKK